MNYETEDKKRKVSIEKTDYLQTDSTKAMPENILHELCECKAEDKEIDYKELTKFEQMIMRLVNRTTYERRIIDAEGAKYAAKLLLPYAKKQLEEGDTGRQKYLTLKSEKEMNDKQKYEDLIERLKKAKEDNSVNDERYCCVIDEIVPELRESEDDKIRKTLIEYFSIGANNNEITCNIEDKKILSWLEKQEQKPAEKAETKFHIGDWVIWDNKVICYIDNIYQGKESLIYTITDTNNMIRSYSVKSFDNNARHWTIQDAKDGDVLARNNDILSICIFSHFDGINNKFSSFLCYCGLEGEGLGQELSINGYHDDSKNYVPATKEQRDTLFAKMREAGYTFDFEKKELKKIGHKSIEWKQENVEELSDFENAMMHIGGSFFGENAGLDPNDTAAIKGQAELLLELAPKTEWSEEDEKNISTIRIALRDAKLDAPQEFESYGKEITVEDFENAESWLKSIKPQKHWKPSQEQMYMLEWLTTNVLDDGVVGNKAKEVLYTLIEQLKSL